MHARTVHDLGVAQGRGVYRLEIRGHIMQFVGRVVRDEGRDSARCGALHWTTSAQGASMLGNVYKRRFLFVLGLGLGGCAHASDQSPVENVVWKGSKYRVLSIDLKRNAITLVGRDPAHRTPAGAAGGQEQAVAVMNAGMFHPNHEAVGLHIEAGEVWKRIQLGDGPGNFHLMPNGVFAMTTAGKPVIQESKSFAENKTAWTWATQSGPLMLERGKIHPAFREGSTNFHIRNGVCVVSDQQVIFAISDTGVRFHDFATLLRDKYGCSDALYLDGAVSFLSARTAPSAAWSPSLPPVTLGPWLVVSQR